MKKVLKITGILLLAVIAFVLIAAVFLPKEVHLEREITVNASPGKIWPLVSKFTNHTKWSPFIRKDPNVVIKYEGTDGTNNAVYSWKGNADVGSGRQNMVSLDEPKRVQTHLHFFEPYDGEAEAFIILTPVGNATKVAWGFDSKYKYPTNAMLMFLDIDEMLGKDYTDGLAKLKALAEQ